MYKVTSFQFFEGARQISLVSITHGAACRKFRRGPLICFSIDFAVVKSFLWLLKLKSRPQWSLLTLNYALPHFRNFNLSDPRGNDFDTFQFRKFRVSLRRGQPRQTKKATLSRSSVVFITFLFLEPILWNFNQLHYNWILSEAGVSIFSSK